MPPRAEQPPGDRPIRPWRFAPLPHVSQESAENSEARDGPGLAVCSECGCLRAADGYWHCGAPSFCPVTGGVALPTKIPQVFVVALFFDVAAHPVPVAEEIDTVFPEETL